MVFVPMLRVRTTFVLSFSIACSVFSVGCLSNKNKDVAVAEAAPPPAAYPASAGYPDSQGGTNPVPAAANSSPVASAPAPAPAREPAPFSLREGEKLVPYQVASGDTLGKIATQYNTSVTRIQAANGMTNTVIYAGRTIQVPTSAPPGGGLAMNSSSAPAPPASTGYGSTPSYGASSSTSSSTGSYPSTTTTPAEPRMPSIPSSSAGSSSTIAPPAVPNSGNPSVSYPSATTPPAPPTPPTFPTPNLGGYQ